MPYVGTTRVEKEKRKDPHPIWRGIGFLLIFIVFGGSYWVATIFLDLNRQGVFMQYIPVPPVAITSLQAQMVGKLPIVGGYIVPAAFAIVIALFSYAFLTIVYGILRGPVTDPRDVRGSSGNRGKKRNVRKCR